MFFKILISEINNKIKNTIFKQKWRSLNSNNYTIANNIFPVNMVEVGDGTYGKLNVRTWNTPDVKLKIGMYCSIAQDVVFMLSGEHAYTTLSTYPFKTFYMKGKEVKNVSKGDIIVEDDVWFGERCIILSGVTIGQGAIIGAGSIVTKDVPPYAIYAGNKIIKYRFPEEIIKKLLKIDYRKLSKENIISNIRELDIDIDNDFMNTNFINSLYKDDMTNIIDTH